jgi:outer membrane receptor protein involved in Fe transport
MGGNGARSWKGLLLVLSQERLWKDFAGAGGVSAVNSLMIQRALLAVVGLLTLCLPLAAQQTNRLEQTEDETITLDQLRRTGAVDTSSALTLYQPDIFSTVDGSVLIHGLPALTLLDGRRFPISGALGRMGMTPLDLFPVAFLSAVDVEKINASPMYGTDSPGGVVNLRLNRDYAGGEVGVFYGRSSGKFGREDKQAYILGGVGDEKFHITAGAAYEESSGRVPRLGR